MVVCAVTCEPVSTSHSLLFPVICIFSGKESLPFAVGSGALYVSPRKLRRLLALGNLAAASNQRKCCPLTGWKRFHNRGKFCPNSEPALCHRPKTAALRPAIIASPLSRTNSRRARPAIRMGDQEKRLYSLVLPRWAAELPTAWAAWRWTKPSDRSRFEKATRSQRYLRCRP